MTGGHVEPAAGKVAEPRFDGLNPSSAAGNDGSSTLNAGKPVGHIKKSPADSRLKFDCSGPNNDDSNYSGGDPHYPSALTAKERSLDMLPDLEGAAKNSGEEPASRFAAAGNNSVKSDVNSSCKRPASLVSKALRGITQRGSGKWQVQIYFAGKSRYIGVYKSKKSATIAFEKAREIAEQTPNLTNERQVNLNLKEIRYLVSEDIAKQSQHGELTRRRSGRSRKADNDEAVEVDDVAGKETRRNSARRALQNTSDLDEFVPVNDEDGADISRRTSRRSKAPPKKLLSSGDIEGSIEESVQTDGRRVKRSSAKTTSLGSVRPKKDSRERDEEPELITDPGPNDLLLGRGGYCKHHPGNIKYREFIRSNKRAYLSNPDKSAFAIAAVAKWRSLGMKESGSAGKFLKQAYGENAEEEVWVDAGDEYAKDKTMQAFRDSDSGTARKEYRINMNGEEEDEDDEVVEPQLKQSTRRRQSKLTSHSEECTQTLRSSPSSVVTPDFTPSSRPTRRYNIQNDSGVTIAEAAASGCNRCRQLLNGVKSKDRHASNCPRKRVGAKNKTSDKDSAGKAKTTKGKTGRGRGRPPKIVGPDTSPIATRRRGRPRLDRCIPVTKPTYDENFDVGGPTKRKVGRPRKELKRSAADLLDERCDGKKQRTGDALSSDDDDKERPTLNKRWSNAEKTQFEQGVIVHGWGEWKKIGHYVKTRNKKQISGYAAKMTLNNPGEKERMLQLHNNNLEDEEMRGGVEKEMIFRAAGVDWTAMKSFRAGHRPWTEDEKQMFATACINEGWGKWHRVEGYIPTRSTRQIESYSYHLQDECPEEVERIVAAHNEFYLLSDEEPIQREEDLPTYIPSDEGSADESDDDEVIDNTGSYQAAEKRLNSGGFDYGYDEDYGAPDYSMCCNEVQEAAQMVVALRGSSAEYATRFEANVPYARTEESDPTKTKMATFSTRGQVEQISIINSMDKNPPPMRAENHVAGQQLPFTRRPIHGTGASGTFPTALAVNSTAPKVVRRTSGRAVKLTSRAASAASLDSLMEDSIGGSDTTEEHVTPRQRQDCSPRPSAGSLTPPPSSSSNKGGTTNAFAIKLFQMLAKEDAGIMSWTQGGLSFVISDRERFVHEVLPRYFRSNKLTSFQRQINLYDFKTVREVSGLGLGLYTHPLFRRDNHSLCFQMKPIKRRR